MMQCYSAYTGLDEDGIKVDHKAKWRRAAVSFYGYDGYNIFMKDFGKQGKKIVATEGNENETNTNAGILCKCFVVGQCTSDMLRR